MLNQKQKDVKIKEVVEAMEKRDNYRSAIEKAVEDSKWTHEDDEGHAVDQDMDQTRQRPLGFL